MEKPSKKHLKEYDTIILRIKTQISKCTKINFGEYTYFSSTFN